ncbi:putative LRR containing protein [Trachipleistophora hominis]|uniref:Putative LRR containing protein n=1 Tax=Trachipleistophora hominis TaxID=72359 RepID=L7JW56_TRAHO|nr:putative LRR containing protein [Trachipleistophora hominis]
MTYNYAQITTIVTVFVLSFNPKYGEKAIGENEYLVINDKTALWFKAEDLLIYGDWDGNKSVKHIRHDSRGSEFAVKLESDSRSDNVKNNEKDTAIKTDINSQNNVAAVKYHVIMLPISKLLYEKISHLSWTSDTEFSFGEICDLLTMLPRFFEREALIMFNIFKNIVKNRSLFWRLNQFFSENKSKQENVHLSNELNWFENISVSFCENGYLILKDQFRNVIVTANDHEQQYKIPIYVELTTNSLFPILVDYLAINYRLLQNSCTDISIIYRETFGLTLDIDFNGFFSKQEEVETCTGETRKLVLSERLRDFYELFDNPLLSLECVNTIILRISSMPYNLNFDFISTKNIQLYCNDCIFSDEICFPISLTALIINDSTINTRLELPQRLDTLIVENCYINTKSSLIVNENCSEITFRNVHGNISFPPYWNLQAIEFHNSFGRMNLQRCQNNFSEVFHIYNVKITDNIELGRNIKTFYLENVQVAQNITLKIHGSCENIMLKSCVGCFDLTDFAKWLKFKFKKIGAVLR